MFILDWKSTSETLLGKPKSLTEDATTGLQDVKERGRKSSLDPPVQIGQLKITN